MNKWILLVWLAAGFTSDAQSLKRADIYIRDPFILPVPETGTYYLYSSIGKRDSTANGFYGVAVYKSKDLENWEGPVTVFRLSDSLRWWPSTGHTPWAPEVHRYKSRYYLFATFHNPSKKIELSDTNPKLPLTERGTAVLVASSPEGPFVPLQKEHKQTPAGWMTLDGTPYFEGRKRYMVFCHEWLQIGDGTVNAVRMKKDFSATKGKPVTLFAATAAPWVDSIGLTPKKEKGYVTDGPWFYRTKKNTLLMLWSSFSAQGYAVGIVVSESGRLKGPWKQEKLLYNNNGGHPMLFKTFDGRVVMSLHQPNSGNTIRARLFIMKDTRNSLEIDAEIPFQ